MLLRGIEDQSSAQYHDDGADQALGRLQRGVPPWLTRYLSTGKDRCTTAARCLVGNERLAMRRGKTGAGLPTIIWNAGIVSSRPATIESAGASATSASRSMMIPKDRLRRLCISQPKVKWSAVVLHHAAAATRRRWEQALSGQLAVSTSKMSLPAS